MRGVHGRLNLEVGVRLLVIDWNVVMVVALARCLKQSVCGAAQVFPYPPPLPL
jgi:hypothetical protein